MLDYEIRQWSETTIRTKGLAAFGLPEFQVTYGHEGQLSLAAGFVKFVVEYMSRDARHVIEAGDTLNYGYWNVKFQPIEKDPDILEVLEVTLDGSGFNKGIERTLTFWKLQTTICSQYKYPFSPPNPSQMAVIDDGFFADLPLEGTRFLAPSHMSGWWFLSSRYDGTNESVKVYHLYHLTEARPDIIPYLALPPGCFFSQGQNSTEIGYDQTLLEE